MATVVNSENYQQFLETGRVDPFKAPEPEKEPEKIELKTEEPAVEKTEDDDDKDLSERVRLKINKKHREKMEAEEFAEQQYNERRAAEKRADQLEQKLKDIEEKSRPAKAEVKEPKQEDFQTVQEYIKALAIFEVAQEREKERLENEQAKITENANKVRAAFADRIAETMKKVPDFEEVTGAVDTELPPYITQHILESDVGPMLGYHLAKHPDELKRVLKLSPIRAIAELGKLEDKLEIKAAPKSEPVSKAPAPITPLEGKSTPVNPDLNRDMSYAEYRALKKGKSGR